MTYCLFALLYDNIPKTSIVWFDTFDNVFFRAVVGSAFCQSLLSFSYICVSYKKRIKDESEEYIQGIASDAFAVFFCGGTLKQ
jgi:hypothetical protein